MQPVQDLTLDDTVSRTQYQFTLESAIPRRSRPGRRSCRDAARSWPELADVVSNQEDNGGWRLRHDRPRQRAAARHQRRHRRQRALRRLRPAHRLDDLHAVEPVPRHHRGRSRPSSARRRRSASIYVPSASGGQVPLSAIAKVRGARPSRCSSTTWRSSRRPRCRSTRRRRLARRGGHAIEGPRPARAPREHPHDLPGRGARVRSNLTNELLLLVAACCDVHRARRALRELHPPDHDPLDAAVGRDRRAAGADAGRRAT
jgi:hypothetical protein